MTTIRRALLSVSDKTGLVELARGLMRHGVSLLSTGGTHKALVDAGLDVTEIARYTGFPEMFEGRIKTLHPKVHGGILFRRDQPSHVQAAAAHAIAPIDLVVINLYPFEQTIARAHVTWEEAIEQIDIGGPAMVRSAAKNHAHVAVLTDPAQYASFLNELDANHGGVSEETRRLLAGAAFRRTAGYDAAIAQYFASTSPSTAKEELFPETLHLKYDLKTKLRYGENPHQQAAFYVDPDYPAAGVASAKQLHGKELSYNNLLDLDSALALAREFDAPAAVVIKHNNPCGVALGSSLREAFAKAYQTDPLSAFGSVLGFNSRVDRETAWAISEPNRFVEAIIAPAFAPESIEVLTMRPSWKNSVRLLETGDLNAHASARAAYALLRPLEGGVLRQTPDLGRVADETRRVVTTTIPTDAQLQDLLFAWTVVKHVRSNAIVVVKEGAALGVGAGQMSRVDSVQIACGKAGERGQGAVLASDAFFPFRDNVDLAAKTGITAIIQPGGSKRDQESIDACNEYGIAMIFTGTRHFKH